MLDFLVQLLEANINFQSISMFILIYFASIWVLFCSWVFVDAKRRYEKNSAGIIFFILVLIFNFPGLIFYLIIRPEKNEDYFLYLQNNELTDANETKAGVDIPIINFVNENGEVNLTFQLKINKVPNNDFNVMPQPLETLQVSVDLPKVEEVITEEINNKAIVFKESINNENRSNKFNLAKFIAPVKSRIQSLQKIKENKIFEDRTSNSKDNLEVSSINKTLSLDAETSSPSAKKSRKNRKDKNKKKHKR